MSVYKQFTYAKNVIQFNIDLFNKIGEYYTPNIRYRDQVTEGYNISPNFFIYGYIADLENFDDDCLEPRGEPKKSFHFRDRLFDRDTLFVHQYEINFLFVIKSYSSGNNLLSAEFSKSAKITFRNSFIKFFNDKERCKYEFYEKDFKNELEMKNFVEKNFRQLNGKAITIEKEKLIISRYKDDDSFSIEDFGLTKTQLK